MDAKLLEKLRESKKITRVVGWNLPISRKASVHIARYIKYLPLKTAKRYLEEVIELRRSVPYFRYNRDVGHRSDAQGIPMGRYPKKAAQHFLKLLDSLEKNALDLGLDPNKLVIIHAAAHKGTTIRGRIRKWIVTRKRTHIEIIAMEIQELEEGKRYSRKALEALVKSILKEWSQK